MLCVIPTSKPQTGDGCVTRQTNGNSRNGRERPRPHITSGGARGPQNTDGISDNVVSVGKGKALIILRSTMSLVHNDAPNAPAKSVMSARLALRCFLNAGKSDRQGSGRSGGDRAEGGRGREDAGRCSRIRGVARHHARMHARHACDPICPEICRSSACALNTDLWVSI